MRNEHEEKKKKCYVFASGFEDFSSGTYDPKYNGYRIGGIEIYRDATMDSEPFLFSVDGYSIIAEIILKQLTVRPKQRLEKEFVKPLITNSDIKKYIPVHSKD